MMKLTADSACTPIDPQERGGGATRWRRLLVLLVLTVVAWSAAAGAAHAAPVSIDNFGENWTPDSSFSRKVIELPTDWASTTPKGTFSENRGATMKMFGAGDDTSGITLSYTLPPGGSPVDLTGGGSNGQILV